MSESHNNRAEASGNPNGLQELMDRSGPSMKTRWMLAAGTVAILGGTALAANSCSTKSSANGSSTLPENVTSPAGDFVAKGAYARGLDDLTDCMVPKFADGDKAILSDVGPAVRRVMKECEPVTDNTWAKMDMYNCVSMTPRIISDQVAQNVKACRDHLTLNHPEEK